MKFKYIQTTFLKLALPFQAFVWTCPGCSGSTQKRKMPLNMKLLNERLLTSKISATMAQFRLRLSSAKKIQKYVRPVLALTSIMAPAMKGALIISPVAQMIGSHLG